VRGEKGANGVVLCCVGSVKENRSRESGDRRAVSKGEQGAENRQGRRMKKGRKRGNGQKRDDERGAGIKQGTGRKEDATRRKASNKSFNKRFEGEVAAWCSRDVVVVETDVGFVGWRDSLGDE
jgi:hypothetical protein